METAHMDRSVKPKKRKLPKKQPSPWPRLLIATFVGYIATVIISAGSTSLLPIHRAEATALSLFIAALIYTFIFIYVFAVPTWWRGLRDVLIATVVFAVILILRRGFFL